MMQSCRGKFLNDLITEEEFRKEMIPRSVNSLKEQGYQFIQNLGSGNYGTMFSARKYKLPDRNDRNENLTVKIVIQECVTRSELELWRTLRHDNVLPPNNVHYIPSAGTFAFFMPFIPSSLDLVSENSVMSAGINGFDLAMSYL